MVPHVDTRASGQELDEASACRGRIAADVAPEHRDLSAARGVGILSVRLLPSLVQTHWCAETTEVRVAIGEREGGLLQ